MPQAVLKRLVRGVSCRDYEGVVDLAREGFGVQKSSVSRSFVKASAKERQNVAGCRKPGVQFLWFLGGFAFQESDPRRIYVLVGNIPLSGWLRLYSIV